MGGGGGPPSKGGLGWGPDWISNWMEPKSFVVGKTRSGIWFLQFYIQRICTRTEEGLVAKSPLSPPSPLPPFTQTQPLKPISFKKYLPSHEPFIARMLRSPSFSDADVSFSWFLSKEDNYVAIVSDNENDTQFRDGRKWFVLNVLIYSLEQTNNFEDEKRLAFVCSPQPALMIDPMKMRRWHLSCPMTRKGIRGGNLNANLSDISFLPCEVLGSLNHWVY